MALTLSGPLIGDGVPSTSISKSASISPQFDRRLIWAGKDFRKFCPIRCSSTPIEKSIRTCKNCKTQFDPSSNHPRACLHHTAHFGGETRRKFESVHSGGTMSTPDGGKVLQYWHCCGSEDPFDPGCTAAPHSSYDD